MNRTARPSSRRALPHLPFLLLCLLLWGPPMAATPTVAAQSSPPAAFDPGLRQQIAAAGSGTYFVRLAAQADLTPAFGIDDWQERGRFVWQTLQETARRTQPPLLALLTAQQAAGSVTSFRAYSIVNGFLVSSPLALFDTLAQTPGVAALEADLRLTAPTIYAPGRPGAQTAAAWGVERIGATAIWRDFNVRGEGIVVANLDTGVDFSHPALVAQYRGALADDAFDHTFNWFDPDYLLGLAPQDGDPRGHGTHTMGTMVGGAGADGPIGVAPAARWIAATGGSSFGQALAAAEWLLAPYAPTAGPAQGNPDRRPHLVNNSWGYLGASNRSFQIAIDAWQAAGMIPIFAAGNTGPGRLNSPADNCATLSVGATNAADQIAHFSGRGPGPYAECAEKPTLTAPGVAVYSTVPDGGYAPYDGTSMAAPHVAGCVALLLSLQPDLSFAQIEALLAQTAIDRGTPGFDPTNGHGRLDCYAAATALTFLHVTPRHLELCTNNPALLEARVVVPGANPPPVTLAAPVTPPELAVAFAANPLTPTTAPLVTNTITLSATSPTVAGIYRLPIVGTAAGRVHTSTVSVRVYPTPPPTPLLQRPPPGAINVGRRPLLQWQAVDAGAYRLEVATDPAFESLVYSRQLAENAHRLVTPLEFETPYFWRVTPMNPCGVGAPSAPAEFLAETTVLRVAAAAEGAAHGASWANAFPDLQQALAAAGPGSEIWVAAGRYSPGPEVDDTFLLADGAAVLGGFSGTEAQRETRNPDPTTNATVLDGGGRSRHVVRGFHVGAQSVLDGFTVTGGLAAQERGKGGGLHLQFSSPKLRNLAILGNRAAQYGGGAYVFGGTPRLEGVTFTENLAVSGGGLYCACPAITLSQVTFLRNQAEFAGGGFYLIGAAVTLVNGLLAGNSAHVAGGGMLLVGEAVVANVALVGNRATTDGGGLFSEGNSPQLSQLSLVANRAGGRGSGLYFNPYSWLPPLTLANSLFWRNRPEQIFIDTGRNGLAQIDSVLLPEGCPANATCSGALHQADPRLLRNPTAGPDGLWGTADDDYGDLALRANSPLLDQGHNPGVAADLLDLDGDGDRTEPLPVDLRGAPRFVDAQTGAVGPPAHVDIGAYEFVPAATPTPPLHRLYIGVFKVS